MNKSSMNLGNQCGRSEGSARMSLYKTMRSEKAKMIHATSAAKKVRRIRALVLNIPKEKANLERLALQ